MYTRKEREPTVNEFIDLCNSDDMFVLDAISQCDGIEINTVPTKNFPITGIHHPISLDLYRIEQKDDPIINSIIQYKLKHPKNVNNFKLVNNILYYCSGNSNPRIYVPESLRKEILLHAHGRTYTAHQGIARTYALLRQEYYWHNMKDDITRLINACLLCQKSKNRTFDIRVPLRSYSTFRPMDMVALDIYGALIGPTPNTKLWLITLIDVFSKYPWIIPVVKPEGEGVTAIDVATNLYTHVFQYFLLPRVIITDRGSNFMSEVFVTLCKHLGIKKIAKVIHILSVFTVFLVRRLPYFHKNINVISFHLFLLYSLLIELHRILLRSILRMRLCLVVCLIFL